MKILEKENAVKLRKSGLSIKHIAQKIGVSKASVSVWVRTIKLSEAQHKQLNTYGHSTLIEEKRRLTRLSNEEVKRNKIIENAKKDISTISLKELKLIGSVLYWAEGTKRGKRVVSFSNSDPFVIKIMMRFFREICNVKEEKFRGHIHTYSHLNVKNSEEYWSKVTNIPLTQFYKTYSKPSKAGKGKMDTLPYGTFDINVCDVILFLTIKGWMEKIGYLILER